LNFLAGSTGLEPAASGVTGRQSRKEIREDERARKEAEAGKWTLRRIFDEYMESRPDNKGKATDNYRFEHLLNLAEKEPKEILPLDVDRIRLKLLKSKSPRPWPMCLIF
jgi:hypothetical protein